MKKKKTHSLQLNKERISEFERIHINGGQKTTKCFYTLKTKCKTLHNSNLYMDCTVTHQACITEPRFCGMFG
ncbi:MAG: hypothetical protein AAF617_09840 [Bacteroidota bacterium]